MEFDFDLVNGIRYQEQNRAIIFSKNGEREFFYSIPPDLSRKAMEMVAKLFRSEILDFRARRGRRAKCFEAVAQLRRKAFCEV